MPESSPPASSFQPPASTSQPTATILAVDDEPLNVKLLEGYLLPQGYRLLTASNGEEALAQLHAGPVDLILLDVMMPGLDGFEVTRRLRAQEATRLIPIVLITALRETEDRIRGIEAGCDDFISKPFDQHELLARVRSLLTLSHYRSLLDDKAKFEQVINRIEDGIIVLTPALGVSRINERAAALCGLDPSTPVRLGLSASLTVAQDSAQGAPAPGLHGPTTPLPAHLAERFAIRYPGDLARDLMIRPLAFDAQRPETPTTRSLTLAIRSSLIQNALGETTSIVLTIRDVTEERKELLMKRDFLSLISHKLRTPIAVIASSASALQDDLVCGPLAAGQREFVAAIHDKAKALDRLIDKLLRFAAVHADTAGGPSAPAVPARDLPRLLEPLLAKVPTKPVAWRLECPQPDAAVPLSGDHLTVIFEQLLDNAVKFNDKDRLDLTVAVSSRADGVELSVSDNGPGIPPEDQPKIFEPFYQVEKYFTGNVEGPGLGLALVRQMVTAAGGTVRVQSQLGHGSAFILSFPYPAIGSTQ